VLNALNQMSATNYNSPNDVSEEMGSCGNRGHKSRVDLSIDVTAASGSVLGVAQASGTSYSSVFIDDLRLFCLI
jgi:hypothetical protein